MNVSVCMCVCVRVCVTYGFYFVLINNNFDTREYMNRNTIFRRRNNMHELLITHFVWILFCRTKYNWFTKFNKKEVLVGQ